MAHAHYGVSIHHSQFRSGDTWNAPWSVPSRVLDSVAKNLLVAMVGCSGSPQDGVQDAQFTLKELVLARWQSTTITKAEN
jgi:hypothetical protein